MIYDPIIELPVFLAYSLEMERESAERLREFSDIMRAHNQQSLAEAFEQLATYSDKHAREISQICKGKNLPTIPAWAFEWPEDQPPETAHYEDISYLMSTRDALEAMLEQEQASAAFYADVADRTPNDEIKYFAREFAEEEREHARALMLWLEKFPPNPPSPVDIDPPRTID